MGRQYVSDLKTIVAKYHQNSHPGELVISGIPIESGVVTFGPYT